MRPHRRRVRTALAVCALLVTTVAPAAAVEADGVRVDPAQDAALGAGSAFRPALLPGASARYDLVVTNRRAETVELLVYAADVDGGTVAAGTENTGVGSWIVFDEQRLELAPEDAATVAFTVTRPADDDGGGTAAVVVQLSDATRVALDLSTLERAALLVEVAADASGDGLLPVVTATRQRAGIRPGALEVDVLVTDPGPGPTSFDGRVELDGLLGAHATDLPVDTVRSGGLTTATVAVDLPWYGALGELRAVTDTVGVRTSSPPVRVVTVPPWAVVLVLLLALRATIRERRRRRAAT